MFAHTSNVRASKIIITKSLLLKTPAARLDTQKSLLWECLIIIRNQVAGKAKTTFIVTDHIPESKLIKLGNLEML